MSGRFTEDHVEQACLDWLEELGYGVLHGPDISPDGNTPERAAYDVTILIDRFKTAFHNINPNLSANACDEALRKLQQTDFPSLVEENRRLHQLMVDGVDVNITRDDGSTGTDKARLIDFEDPTNNDWVAVNQFTVIEGGKNRRPDVVVFVNGLPLVVIELKNPVDEDATIDDAYNQLQTYKDEIPSLFRTNSLLVTSDGLLARIGSLTANSERFMAWRTVDGETIAPKGVPELEILINGVFNKSNLLSMLRGFTVFENTGSDLIKKIAGYHQFHAVHKAVQCTINATDDSGDNRVGVIWHTQGSGKSLLMAFYAGEVIAHPMMENPTLIVLTDRNDLDDQLFATFAGCKDLIRQTPVQADDREHLQKLLAVPSGGVIFTTIQKFSPVQGESEYPMLTERRNVVVIADEAHRSQYGLKAKVAGDSGKVSYGFAKHLRDAIPNASFIGFTGTPIEATDVNTPAVFGDYIDIYDIQRGVEDGATVPIYYESRLARIELDQDEIAKIDEEIDDLVDKEDTTDAEKKKGRWSRVEALVGAEDRLKMVAADLVDHFESRVEAMDGKAMIVCMSRRICIALYDAIIAIRPDWHSDDDDKGKVKVVMTGSASDPKDWQQHIGNKSRRDLLAKRAKKANDELKIVLVRDMWLTGFDAPSMHTMYVDKPMKGHGLMQAIARVNRVFKDKPGGLIVDYIGIAQSLKNALGSYSGGDKGNTGISQADAIAVMLEKYEIVKDMFFEFDYLPGLKGEPKDRLAVMAGAMEWILELQRKAAEKETSKDAKKQAHRRYSDAVLNLSKAFALAASSDEAKVIRDEVGFFQAIRAALIKSTGVLINPKQNELAIQQIISRAVVSTEIVDILKAAGMESQDISILSDEFLNEIQGMEKKNLALEALKKLINGEIKSKLNSRVVKTKAFSERLAESINRYHLNALTTAQVLEELIKLAKEIRAEMENRGKDGLSEDEVAFYEALSENNSAVDLMGDAKLKLIAHELLQSVRSNATVDWQQSEMARAKIRVAVKRILKKYGYPPDLETEAIKVVLQQAEASSQKWAA
ncbi:type I restriction endonuclease subunit R [Alphaproteobacteria bacterium]|nr:type I restriction endonuclease subunit R [Alphaproteobacteria bacterium]